MSRGVFLDRDGVINRAMIKDGRPYPPCTLKELEILPGVSEALVRLRVAGFYLIVVTNQPDVARGTQSRAEIEKMHAALARKLPLDEFKVCYHDDSDKCDCRKPKPGLLLEAAHGHRLDMASSFMVGDRWRDMEAGRRAGCRTVFIDRGYAEPRPDSYNMKAGSLIEASELICAATRRR